MLSRKRLKLNPKSEASTSTTSLACKVPLPEEDKTEREIDVDAASQEVSRKGPQRTGSGPVATWPRKAAPVAAYVARETISSAEHAASNLIACSQAHLIPSRSRKSSSFYLSKSIGDSSISLPKSTTSTELNGNTEQIGDVERRMGKKSKEDLKSQEDTKAKNNANEITNEQNGKPVEVMASKSDSPNREDPSPMDIEKGLNPVRTSTWFGGWFSNPGDTTTPTSNVEGESQVREESPARPEPDPIPEEQPPKSAEPVLDLPNSTQTQPSQTRSWFSIWNSSAPAAVQNSSDDQQMADAPPETSKSSTCNTQDVQPDQAPPTPMDASKISDGTASKNRKSSGWAFWSRDIPKEDGQESSPAPVGELAVANTPSQNNPEAAVVKSPETTSSPRRAKKKSNPSKVDDKNNKDQLITAANGKAAGVAVETAKHPPEPKTEDRTAKLPSNLLLPSVRETYRDFSSPSLLSQIARLFRYYGKSPEIRHPSLIRDPPRIKKALAIGVHGYFPAPFIRNILGQPTGTSVKFANSAAEAVRQWSSQHGYSCDVEVVALEGEGKIAERVEILWKLLLNWIEAIRKADFVIMACHSQGVPVGVMLIEKLIEFGCVNASRIAICAMAGINMGPQGYLKSRFIGGSAGELFEFSRTDSQVSQNYAKALKRLLDYGVKVTYVGSIDDQLVSLESSTFSTMNHPNLYRAVFVDGRIHAPNFLIKLVGFILKLRNLGVSDHGLIRELSAPLAGSLYSGEGHSRIYEDEVVYSLALEFALATTAVNNLPLEIHDSPPNSSQNPYILPFAMRGLLEEDCVKMQLAEETEELLKEFDSWKPTTKQLKDVKFRLEGVRSRL
ncbi:MAG: hypothetical protein M1834_004851 [Cirrosporium novae-zelandiae]|nr:MAG: hypothetical protein M1834_004851 [Cirrosporium novae-zelandiae]